MARVNELGGEGPFALSGDGVDVVVVRTPDGLKGYQGLCPHQGALLGEGELDDGTLVCRNHRWRFDVATGRRRGGPQCLEACPLELRDGELWADVSALRRAREERTGSLRRVRDLPGPRGLPVLGNTLQIRVSRMHAILERWAAEYGPLYRFRLGPSRVVGVADPGVSEQILRARPGSFRRSSNIESVLAEAGIAGVFSAEGDVWRPQRRLAMHALSHRHLKGFYPTLVTVAERLHKRWQAKADAGTPLDLADELKRFTVDVTTMLAFAYDANTIEQHGDVIQRKLALVFPAITRRLFALVPTWRWIRTPADRRLDRALAEVRLWLADRIADARGRLDADPARAGRPENFLESMLAARDDDGRPFSDDVIFGNALTMLLAGEDTTAYTLAWTAHHLCDSPEPLAALRAEADALLGEHDVPPDIETADRLVYAGATANEAMRVRPVAPFLLFEANEDVVLRDVAVPKGTWLAVLTRPPVLEERNFHSPATFIPERWLDEPEAGRAHDASAHMPFGNGPRICPGRTLALLEMKIVLAMLYRSFEVERVGDAADVGERFSFTMMPEGLKVRLRRRNGAVP